MAASIRSRSADGKWSSTGCKRPVDWSHPGTSSCGLKMAAVSNSTQRLKTILESVRSKLLMPDMIGAIQDRRDALGDYDDGI